MLGSDRAFIEACKEAGLSVGIQSGLVLLAVRKVFEAGGRHLMWRHLSELWAEHEALNTGLCVSVDRSADCSDMELIRGHIAQLRERYLK